MSRMEPVRRKARFRLRHRGTWYELPVGDFVVGRSAGCHLLVDDPRVSRRHARFRAEPHRVTVEDLQSRNGVLVNGVLLRGPMVLTHEDVIVIGSQEMRFSTVFDAEPLAAHPGLSSRDDGFEDATQTGGLPPIVGLMERPSRAGSQEDGERVLRDFYAELGRDGTATPRASGPLVVETVTRLTLAHAATTQRGDWIDRLFGLYLRNRQVMPIARIDEIIGLLGQMGHPRSRELRGYVEWLHGEVDRLGPTERFGLQRLEDLVRGAALDAGD